VIINIFFKISRVFQRNTVVKTRPGKKGYLRLTLLVVDNVLDFFYRRVMEMFSVLFFTGTQQWCDRVMVEIDVQLKSIER